MHTNFKILIINGTTRKEGNTDQMLKEFSKGLADAGISYTLINLKKLNIHHCIGCHYCYKHPQCSQKDDMAALLPQLEKADIVVFASPLYWWGVTALMKTFIDRMYVYFPRTNTPLIAGTKAVILTPMAVKEVYPEASPLEEFYRLVFKRLGITIQRMEYFSGINKKGEFIQHKEMCKKAYELGLTMADSIK